MFQEKCYKLFRERKSSVRAQRHCENEGRGGELAAPYTNMQVELQMIYHNSICIVKCLQYINLFKAHGNIIFSREISWKTLRG